MMTVDELIVRLQRVSDIGAGDLVVTVGFQSEDYLDYELVKDVCVYGSNGRHGPKYLMLGNDLDSIKTVLSIS